MNNTKQKFGKRKKNTPNKDKTNVRAKFQLLVENNIATLQSDLDSLKPIDRAKAIIDLSKFVLPTLKAIDFQNNDEAERINRVTNNFVKKDGATN
jgi:hypothetical protein